VSANLQVPAPAALHVSATGVVALPGALSFGGIVHLLNEVVVVPPEHNDFGQKPQGIALPGMKALSTA
jgi:hypothetical protein